MFSVDIPSTAPNRVGNQYTHANKSTELIKVACICNVFVNFYGTELQVSLVAQLVKILSVRQEMQETRVQSLGWEEPLGKEMSTNLFQYCCLEIPWTEEPEGLQFMGLQRVGHNLGTKPPPPS